MPADLPPGATGYDSGAAYDEAFGADGEPRAAYVDDLVRFFLSEEPLMPSVRTYDLLDPRRREEALDRLAELVAKPRDGQGGEGVVVGPVASAEHVRAARDAIVAAPQDWIVQDVITMSTHPTVVDGGSLRGTSTCVRSS